MLCWFLLFCFQSADFKILPSSYGHARDAYAFGTTVENLLTVLNDQGESDIGLFGWWQPLWFVPCVVEHFTFCCSWQECCGLCCS